jgi:WD40 repeat protein
LETIVAKAMSKQPDERYQTAEQLASDLRAFLEHRPITAQPASVMDQARKWARRHETFVRTAGAASLLLTAILVVSIILVKKAHTKALAALEHTSDLLYMADMTAAYQAHEKGWFDEARMNLDRYRPTGNETDRRGLEWWLLQKSVQPPELVTLAGHEEQVNELAVFPDQCRIASVGKDGTLRIWDIREQRLLKTIHICDAELCSVAISPDGQLVAVGSTAIFLCELEQGNHVEVIFRSKLIGEDGQDLDEEGPGFESLAFSGDGRHLVAGAKYDNVVCISLDGHMVNRIPCASRVESLEFIPGSDLLLVPNRRDVAGHKTTEQIVELWDERLSHMERELDASQTGRRSRITNARTSPCGRFVLAGEKYESRAYLFDRASGRVIVETPASRDRLTDVAYSPDGTAIAIGYRNGRIEYFQLQAGADGTPAVIRRPWVINAHRGEVMSVRFVDSTTLASSGKDGLVQICSLPDIASRRLHLPDSRLTGLALSPDGSLLLFVCAKEFGIATTDNGEVVFRFSDPQARFAHAAWSPMGDKLAVNFQHTASVAILNRRGQQICSVTHDGLSEAIALSPSGSLIAVANDRHLQICNSDSGREVCRQSLSRSIENMTFSHDATRIAYGGESGDITILDVSQMRPLRELTSGSDVNGLFFSPDDSLLATAHSDGIIRVWDIETGELSSELLGHERLVRDSTFTPDGKVLLSSSDDGTIRLWSIVHNRGYGILYRRFGPALRDDICRLSLSSDGRVLAACLGIKGQDGPHVLLWKLDPVSTQ